MPCRMRSIPSMWREARWHGMTAARLSEPCVGPVTQFSEPCCLWYPSRRDELEEPGVEQRDTPGFERSAFGPCKGSSCHAISTSKPMGRIAFDCGCSIRHTEATRTVRRTVPPSIDTVRRTVPQGSHTPAPKKKKPDYRLSSVVESKEERETRHTQYATDSRACQESAEFFSVLAHEAANREA